MFDLNKHTSKILGTLSHLSGPMAHRLRDIGHDIPRKIEEEQAYVLHKMLCCWEEHGDDWPRQWRIFLELPVDCPRCQGKYDGKAQYCEDCNKELDAVESVFRKGKQ